MLYSAEARILVVDDEPDVLAGYQQVLSALVTPQVDDVAALAAELFSTTNPARSYTISIAGVDLCRQGEDAVRHLEAKHDEGGRYPVAFIDMRMPPGINGLETAKRLRRLNPDLNIVVVTGYSDYPAQQIAAELGHTDRFFYLVKPFNPDELLQLTVSLVTRWKLERDAADLLARKIAELELSHAALTKSEATAQQLRKQIQGLIDGSKRLEAYWDTGDHSQLLKVTHQSVSDASEHTQDDLQAAFHRGCAAYDQQGGLGLCPYSALNETELFTAFVAGYNLRRDADAS